MMRVIRKHLRDFAALIVLAVISVGVGGYILSNQRLYLPKWVPLVGSDFFTLKGEFDTAQSITPGQGQQVAIAGVKIGEISSVDLVGGRALITMKIKRKYAHIYPDARALLRPKTGLNDMLVELTPGSPTPNPRGPTRRQVPDGWTIPLAQTRPNVNFDEILASLDADTRDYLKLLIGGLGEGLKGQGHQLANDFARFDPTARFLDRATRQLSRRSANIRRTIHNFALLSHALGSKDRQLASLVSNSNAVFQAFADQDARLREALSLLPGTLGSARTSLAKADKLATKLGPTLNRLRPAARALGPALRATRPFFRKTTPVIAKQLRPFARDALPTVKALNPAARDIAALSPDLVKTLHVVNYLFNELAYNPPGDSEEGFLFWLAWANHNGNSVFSNADAHGPVRRGLFLASCSTLNGLDQVGAVNPAVGALVALLNPVRTSAVCPVSAQANQTAAARKGG